MIRERLFCSQSQAFCMRASCARLTCSLKMVGLRRAGFSAQDGREIKRGIANHKST